MTVRRKFLFASLAATLAAAVFVSTEGASQSERFSINKNFDAPGSDYQQMDVKSLRQCRSLCAADSACGAFTYNIEQRFCFLKDSSDIALVPFEGAITGVKTAGGPSGGQQRPSAQGAQYVVDGFALGGKIDPASETYRSYRCAPSDKFAEAVLCKKSRTAASQAVISSELVHGQDGTALYGMVHVAPANITQAIVEPEIQDLSATIGARPTSVVWLPEYGPEKTAVIATWGDVKLVDVRIDTYDEDTPAEDQHPGILVGALGDAQRSAEDYQPVYRIEGGPGYVYSASFGNRAPAHRRYVSVDPPALAVKQFKTSLRQTLQQDADLPDDDYSLWADVALLSRRLALDASPEIANRASDEVFSAFDSKKLQSRVWSILPSGAIGRLGNGAYWRHDIYGPRTGHPKIRSDALELIAESPNEPFIEFAYFVVGDLDGALAAAPDSAIKDILHYARGHRMVESLTKDALAIANTRITPQHSDDERETLAYLLTVDPDGYDDEDELDLGGFVDSSLRFINGAPDLFDGKPLGEHIPDFAARAAKARAHFEVPLNNPSSRHADDAAYMIGWLEMHQGNLIEALELFHRAFYDETTEGEMSDEEWDAMLGASDYDGAARRQNVRIISGMPLQQQAPTVEASEALSGVPSLWYVAARAAYRNFDYERTIDIAERALTALKVPVDILPVTTSPERISAALGKIDPAFNQNLNLVELPYLLEASRELSRYKAAVDDLGAMPPEDFTKMAKAVIIKYSKLLDEPEDEEEEEASNVKPPTALEHKDLRQALHLIEVTGAAVPQDKAYDELRAWLYYRKGRILAVRAPEKMSKVIAQLEEAFPNSELLDDAMAEQIFAQGITLGNVEAAEETFAALLKNHPDGNAIDNAHSWMAIMYACNGRMEDANKINKQIIRRFPLTRHATYARQRLSDPDRWIGGPSCGGWD